MTPIRYFFCESKDLTILDILLCNLIKYLCDIMSQSYDYDTRASLQFTVGESDIDATLNRNEYKSIDFILRNLGIAKDFEKDGSCSVYTRYKLAEMISMQIGFYLFCALKVCLFSREDPKILIFGTGFIGSQVIKDMIQRGMASYIYIYVRGDDDIPYWKSKGVNINSSLRALFPNQSKPDIIVMCTPLSSFPVIAKQLKNIVDRRTLIIYATIGLQRRRVYNTIHVPTILRTYQEPIPLNRQLRRLDTNTDTTKIPEFDPNIGEKIAATLNIDSNVFAALNGSLGSPSTQTTQDLSADDDDVFSPSEDASSAFVNSSGQMDRAKSSQIFMENLSDMEVSAELIVQRVLDIRNFIYMMENFYALHGMSHPMARHEALLSVLLYQDIEYEKYQMKVDDNQIARLSRANSRQNTGTSQRDTNKAHIQFRDEFEEGEEARHKANFDRLSEVLNKLSEWVGATYQKQFSKHIKVINIPRISHVIDRLSEVNKYIRHGNEFTQVSKEIKSLAENILKYENANNYYMDHTKRFYDGAGTHMHQDNLITKIFDQDRKYIDTLDQNDSDDDIDGIDGDSLDELSSIGFIKSEIYDYSHTHNGEDILLPKVASNLQEILNLELLHAVSAIDNLDNTKSKSETSEGTEPSNKVKNIVTKLNELLPSDLRSQITDDLDD